MNHQVGIRSSYLMGIHDHSSVPEGGAVPLGSISGHIKAPHDALLIDADTVDGENVKFSSCVASANVRNSNDAVVTLVGILDYTKKKEIRIDSDTLGTLRVLWKMKTNVANDRVYSRLYLNGVAVGNEEFTDSTIYAEYSHDLGVLSNGDLIQIWLNSGGVGFTCSVKEQRLAYDKGITEIGGETLDAILATEIYPATNQDP